MMPGRSKRRGLPGLAGVLAMLAACSGAPPNVTDALATACVDARDEFSAAPAPVDADTETAFLEASREATRAVARVADDLAARGDDMTIADLAWQLYRFPAASDADDVLAVAHEASAAITRIDQFATVLAVPECGAATWRTDDWSAMAARHADRPNDAAFRRSLMRLCAETFPEPSLLTSGMPLLDALVADAAGRARPSEDVKGRVIARLNTVTTRPSAASRFIGDFSKELPRIRPSGRLEQRYFALLAAFMRLDSAVPSAMPKDPPPAVRERVEAALDDLQHAWEELDIRCRN